MNADYEQQTRRRANLRHLTNQLAEEGEVPLAAQGAALSYLTEGEFRSLLDGTHISDEIAREVEAVQRPDGWMDASRDDPLDD